MKHVLLIASVLFSFSALARPELGIDAFRDSKPQTREVSKASCPREKPQNRVAMVMRTEINERFTR